MDTPFGGVLLSVTSRDHVYVGFSGQYGQPKIAVNGGVVQGNMHFFRQEDGTFSVDLRAVGRAGEAIDVDNERGKPASEAARRKLREVMTPLVNAWAAKHKGLFERAQQAKVKLERESIERDIAKLEEQLRAKFDELYALES